MFEFIKDILTNYFSGELGNAGIPQKATVILFFGFIVGSCLYKAGLGLWHYIKNSFTPRIKKDIYELAYNKCKELLEEHENNSMPLKELMDRFAKMQKSIFITKEKIEEKYVKKEDFSQISKVVHDMELEIVRLKAKIEE